MRSILALVLSLTGTAAFADQCLWNSASDATSAKQLINLHREVMFYCQYCGDSKPSFITQVSNVQTGQATMGDQRYPYRVVKLTTAEGEKEVDLAYLYVRTASDMFANVAQLVGCPSDGAVTFIQTTNKNQKLQHYYNEQGVRVSVATTNAQNTTTGNGGTGRVPASTAKKK